MMLPILICLFLAIAAQAQVSVTTYRNNLARTGANLEERVLTPANVNPGAFGKLFSLPVDGQVYAQPLYLPSLNIPGKGVRNAVFVATEHDSVYAFDADSAAAPLWQINFTDAAAGETTVSVADVLGCPSIAPELGITGTPVIDPSTRTLYVVASTIRNGTFYHRLHALDAATGAERPGSPVVIDASAPGTGDGFSQTTVQFHPYLYKNRAGLLLLNGIVYTAWTSHCDTGSYHGWLIGYDAADLQPAAIYNDSPNAFQGSLWMGGAAPAADADGNIYVISGNGVFDGDTGGSDLGDSFIKLSSAVGLSIADYFTPFNQLSLSRGDIDLGSSGALLLPDEAGNATHPHLVVSAGKEGRIYLLDRDQMGHFHPGSDSQIVQSIAGAIGPLYGGAAYFNHTLYFAGAGDSLKAFAISDAHLTTSPISQSPESFGELGSAPAVSANGSANGIVWVVGSGAGGGLHAYDASNLANELYNSQMNATRDALGSFVKFSVPTVANGKVYVGTSNSLTVFGLLNLPPQPSPTALVNAASLQPGPVAPGSLISIFGSNLAPATAPAGPPPLPKSLGGVAVSINGTPCPLLFVGPNQINAQVPLEVNTGPAIAVLQLPQMPQSAIGLSIAQAAPGIFMNGQNQAAVQNADGSLNGPANPAGAGSVISVYLTGQGPVSPAVATGAPAPANPLASPVYPVAVTFGGRDGVVTAAALSPGSAGVLQVSVRVPAIRTGSYGLVVKVNGVPSNTATINVSGSPPGTTTPQKENKPSVQERSSNLPSGRLY
jgi:uncharacterized protein (TIGR03437 family)